MCLDIQSFINKTVVCIPVYFALMAQDNESEETQLGGNECFSQVLFLLSVLSLKL